MRTNKLRQILDMQVCDANELKVHYTKQYIDDFKKVGFHSGTLSGSIEFSGVVAILKKAQSLAESEKNNEANAAADSAVKEMSRDIKGLYDMLKSKEKELEKLAKIYKETL